MSSSSTSKCCNPACSSAERGKLKCSACLTTFYCSPECGKKHWPVHKLVCAKAKSQNNAAAATSPQVKSAATIAKTHPDLLKQLEDAKKQLQQLFQKRDFANAAIIGEKALGFTKELMSMNAPMGLTESIQIQLNLTTAYLETRKLTEANTTSEQCVALCEVCVKQQPNHPQFVEMSTLALTSRSLVLMHLNKLDEAHTTIMKCMTMCDTIFSNKEPKLCKSIRIHALILEKKGMSADAEKLMFRGYLIYTVSIGISTRDCQTFFDELIEMVTRRKDYKQAEVYALKNYESLKTWDAGKNSLEFGEVSARLGSLYGLQGKFIEAKSYLEKTVEIRSTKLGPNHVGTAHAILQVCTLYEKMNNFTTEVEGMLLRVVEIFAANYGQDSNEVSSTLAQIRRVRSKRTNGGVPSQSTVFASKKDDDNSDEEIECHVAEESTMVKTKATNLSEYDLKVLRPSDPSDANGRLLLANKFFEMALYSHAEIMLSEAHEIIVADEGAESERCQMALQNLNVARQKGLNKLWMQVVTELMLQEAEQDPSQSTISSNPVQDILNGVDRSDRSKSVKPTVAAESGSNGSTNGSVADDGKYSADERDAISEYKRLIANTKAMSLDGDSKTTCSMC